MPAVSLSTPAADAAAKADTVAVNSRRYFIGETAVIHSGGRVLDGLTDEWVASPEYLALMAGGYNKAIKRMGTDDVTVAIGLPSRLYARQKDRLRVSASSTLGVQSSQVVVLPQPMAAFYNYILNANGGASQNLKFDDRWYVVDVGYYTTDFGCSDHTVWAAGGQDSVQGTYTAAIALKREVAAQYGIDISVRDAETALRTGSIRDQGEVIDLGPIVATVIEPLARSIIDSATQIWGTANVRSAAGIYVAGGGSSLVFDKVKETWRHAVCAENARFAVAEGLRRSATAFKTVAV